jgi:murein DD-endopeptidase MepM/ murein hydrolase activator NlpD
MMNRNLVCVGLLVSSIFLAGCSGGPFIPATEASLPTQTTEPSPPATKLPPTTTPTPLPTLTPTPNYFGFTLQSPLQDLQLTELLEIKTTDFNPPPPGGDGGHHGVDFAYYSRGTHQKMEGLEIYSMVPGKVAGVSNELPPYGNLIIIETPLENIPPDLVSRLPVMPAATPYPYNPRMEACGDYSTNQTGFVPDTLYTLYAHMQYPATLQVGDVVNAGDLIGYVGNSGKEYSGNPHLHLEMRLGTGGTEFASMGYYTTSAMEAERLQYCVWRVSGLFILLNPLDVIDAWMQFKQPGG